jgi:hypothetical protein
LAPLPPASKRAGTVLGFDALGQPKPLPFSEFREGLFFGFYDYGVWSDTTTDITDIGAWGDF